MGGENEKPQHHRPEMSQDVLDQEKIPQRFTHFLRVNCDKTVVNPVADERRTTGERLRLSHFILMMRENQITAAAVEIKAATQVFIRHCTAFDVPTGASIPPGTFPEWFAWFGAFPEGKIHRMTFAVIHFDPSAGFHSIE